MYEIFHEFGFEAAHYLPHVAAGHPCGRMHGHSYRVVVYLRGPLDPRMGWVRDFAELQDAWRAVHEQLDHRVLNEVVGLENPTAEHIAGFVLRELRRAIPEVAELELRETPTTGVRLRADASG